MSAGSIVNCFKLNTVCLRHSLTALNISKASCSTHPSFGQDCDIETWWYVKTSAVFAAKTCIIVTEKRHKCRHKISQFYNYFNNNQWWITKERIASCKFVHKYSQQISSLQTKLHIALNVSSHTQQFLSITWHLKEIDLSRCSFR